MNLKLKLLDQVKQIQNQFIGGEMFFNHLDLYITDNIKTLSIKLLDQIDTNQTIVLSGGFGKQFVQTLHPDSFILFNGSIRKRIAPKILTSKIIHQECVFIDDSFYSGKTFRAVQEYLKTKQLDLNDIATIYDGSKLKQANVHSLLRYYDYFKIN